MRRRVLSMLLALAMVCSLAVHAGAEEVETAPQLSLEVTQGKGSVTIQVYLEGCDGVTNGRFSVGYDAQVLSFESAQTTEAYAMSSVNSETAGSVSLAWVGSELTNEKTLMLTLHLTAAESIAQDMTYTTASEGIYVLTEDAGVTGDSVTVTYTAQVDLTELMEAIETAESLNKSNYTADSFAKVEDALADAALVLADSDATQEEVDAAAKALKAAIAALVTVGGNTGTGDNKDPQTGDESHILAALGVMLAAAVAIAGMAYYAVRFDKEKQVRRIVAMVLLVCMTASLLPMDTFAVVLGEDQLGVSDKLAESLKNTIVNGAGGSAQKVEGSADLKLEQNISAILDSIYDDNDLVRIIVELEGEGLLEQGYTDQQIADGDQRAENDEEKLLKAQKAIVGRIEKALGHTVEVKYNYTIALNGFAMTVPYGELEQIRNVSGVAGAYIVSQYMAPESADTQGDYDTNMYATKDSFGSAKTWNDLGYTGKGMTIAVIDTGLDVDHPSFSGAPEGGAITFEDVQAVLTELNAYTLFTQTSAVKLTAEKLYYSGKVPFGFNYVDCSVDVTHDFDTQGDHGTHVAGIAAANVVTTSEVVGVAPDAQVVVMKVFGQNGGAYSDDILAAIEDCMTLGVDVINMSLGAQAGFSEDSALINEVYGRILQTDMILAVAAGNANSAATGNTLGTNLNFTSDPDNGLVNSPATYLAATTVASLENVAMMMPYFTVGEQKMVYVDVTYFNFAALAGSYAYVVVPGVGDASDYEGLDVAGKVALVQRGTIDFVTKQKNAYDKGAVALVVYDNVEGDLVSMYDGGYLPNVFISKADGEAMVAAAENGEGKMTIMPYGVETAVPNSVAGQLSDFSCWGVTPDLQLVPDVTAPGGNIYSTYTDGAYGTMSGTSMASPHIAGMAALVLQYLRQEHPDLSEADMHIAAEALIMCTAQPVTDPDGVLYSPRKQGAGAANVYNAVSSPVYLTKYQTPTGEWTPKASMGDDPERTGVFTFTFQMNNLTDQEQVYMLSGSLLTDQYVVIDGREFMGEYGRDLTGQVSFAFLNSAQAPDYDANQDGKTNMDDVQFLLDVANGLEVLADSLTEKMDLHGDGVINTVDAQLLYELLLAYVEVQNLITVPAGGSISVDVTVTLSAEDMAYMDEHYPNGIYVDGFVRAYAQSEGAVDLSLPLCGFYGGWHEAPMLDTGWYYEDEETVEFNRYYHVIFATLGADNAGGLGINPYITEEYDPEHNVLSPNGDTYYDYVPDIYISLMRSAELLDFTWTDEEGNELFYEWYGYARKSYYWSGYGMCMPIIYSDGGCLPYTFYDENGNLMVEDLDHITLTIRGYLDDGDLDDIGYNEDGDPIPDPADADAVLEIPITIDMTAPTMDISSIEYFTEEGRNYVRFDVEDNYDLAAVVAMTVGGGAYEYVPVTTKTAGVDGEKDTVTLDITDYDASFQIVLCDYGCNESYYVLTNENSSGLSGGRFYAYRRYSTVEAGGALYTTDQLNGWYSFENADSMVMHTSQANSGEATVFAAEYIDGYIFGAQGGVNGYNTLFVSKAGSWERIQLGSEYELRKTVYEWPGRDGTYFPMHLIALDMAYDYTTDTLYMLANALETEYELYFPDGEINILCSVDIATGKVNVLGKIFGENDEDLLALTLACDNEGVLYTINYENGKLYTINKTPTATTEEFGYGTYVATCVNPDSETKYWPAAYSQSMTVDHATNTLYWAGYQGTIGTAAFVQMDKATGEIVTMTYTENNGEMVGLFVPYDSGKDLIADAELTGIALNNSELYMNVGQNTTLLASPVPYNAQLGDVEWTSADESIATVSPYGIVVAVGVGSTTITATCGDYSASCDVFVSNVDGTLFAFSDEYWLLMDAGKPFQASQVVDALEADGQIRAAAYLHGYLYAAAVKTSYDPDGNPVETTNIYKLNASTLQGELLGSFDGRVTALAFNYADGFMYGLRYTETYDANYNAVCTYELIRLNVNTAEYAVVTDLNSLYPYSDLTGQYQVCSGALAIDYDGNFYVSGDNAQYEYNLVRFNLDENGQIADVTEYAGFTAYDWDGDAMVWSQRNGGLLHVSGDTLAWVDVSDMTDVKIISLGQIRGANAATHALAIPLTGEPAIEYATPESMTLESVYTVPRGETVRVAPTVNPWNASGTFTYAIADTSIAVVDEKGVVTGLVEGSTTITVTEVASGLTATATIEVVKNPGYLFGYFQANITEQIPLEAWAKIPISNPANFNFVSDLYDLTIYAGTFYDGYIYGVGKHGVDGNLYLLKIDPSNYVYNIMGKVDVLIRGMAFDYTTGTMYAVGSTESIAGGLYQLNIATGEFTFLADNDLGVTLVTLACDDQGVLYTADENGDVYTMDKDDAQLHSTGISGNSSPYLQSMAYDFNNDAIYWANGTTMWQLDTQNSALINLGTTGCSISGLFAVPYDAVSVPETVVPNGVAMAEKNTVAVGETLKVKAVVLPVSVATVDQTLVWTSGDETIATVDENGVITGVAPGEVMITATNASGQSDTIKITVTAEHRYFYGYDEITKSWVRFGPDGVVLETWKDTEGLSPIVAAQYINGTLYAYDADGYFYSVDTETFQRTLLGNGIHGMTTSLEAWDKTHNEQVYFVDDIPYQVIDMTYTETIDRRGNLVTELYAVIMAYNVSQWRDSFSYKVVRVSLSNGQVIKTIVEDKLVDYEMSLRPSNLLYRNGKLWTINGYITGMITIIDPTTGSVSGSHIFPTYWGDFNGGRSLIEDPLTGETYAIRDMRTEYIGMADYTGAYATSELCTIDLGVANCDSLAVVGSNMRIVGLFIK